MYNTFEHALLSCTRFMFLVACFRSHMRRHNHGFKTTAVRKPNLWNKREVLLYTAYSSFRENVVGSFRENVVHTYSVKVSEN